MNVDTFFISHRIFCCFVYHGLWSQGHRSREIFKSAFISRFHWNHPSLILVSLDSLDGFSETSKFFAVFLKPCGGFRARIWPEMAKSKVSENCHQLHVQFQKTFTSLCSFEKNYQFHVQFQKKMSTLSVVWVKPFVILQKKKNTITSCDFDSLQKKTKSSCKILKLCPFFFLQLFLNFFIFSPNYFSNLQFRVYFLCIFFFLHFF